MERIYSDCHLNEPKAHTIKNNSRPESSAKCLGNHAPATLKLGVGCSHKQSIPRVPTFRQASNSKVRTTTESVPDDVNQRLVHADLSLSRQVNPLAAFGRSQATSTLRRSINVTCTSPLATWHPNGVCIALHNHIAISKVTASLHASSKTLAARVASHVR